MGWFIFGVLAFALAWPLICWFATRDRSEGGVVPSGTVGIRRDEVPALLSRTKPTDSPVRV